MVNRQTTEGGPDKIFKSVHKAFSAEVPRHVEQRLKARLDGFRDDLQVHPSISEEGRYRLSLHLKTINKGLTRPVAAVCTSLIAVGLLLVLISGKSNPSWANMLKHFGRSNFVTASVYIRHQPFAEPQMVEYWFGRGNKLRILSGHLVTFASPTGTRTFNLATRNKCVADGPAKFIMNLYGYEDSLIPLASYIKALYLDLYQGKALESTYQINASPEISEDLLVYDLKHKMSGLFLRVWVLRTSMLPIRLHYWNDYGSRTDVLFSYSKEQPDGFFDPDLFEATMKQGPDKISTARLMYLGLKDAGDKIIPAPGI